MAGSPYTLETAREILLGKRSPAIKTLDRLLGVTLLAAGPIGLLTGQAWMLVAWGWVDQKNELVVRLDELVSKGRAKLGKATGKERHELLAAAHTAIVIASYFAALREVAGPVYDRLELTEAEKRRLASSSNTPGDALRDATHHLLRNDVGLPWAGSGFEANLDTNIRPYYAQLTERSLAFFSGLYEWGRDHDDRWWPLQQSIVDRAADRYRAEYFALAAEIPEFRIWALFGEHLAEQNALGRLEDLVDTLVGTSKAPGTAVRKAIAGINRAILTRPVVDLDETAQLTAVRVPTVEHGYVEPHFRWAVVDRSSQPAQESWWEQQDRGTDLAGFLAAHFASPRAAALPLVVLGHPGAGKSLFTKVCAARLASTDAFTTVRVPLRDVPDPSASVYRQIEDVLRESTHGKVEWPRLCEASKQLVRVVLIDGLDELMQATGATESRYLRNVVEFQRTEAATSGPVAVVVTSRTVVADLAAIPHGCLVVKLEEFTDDQIDTWVDRWKAANTAAVASGEVRAIEAATMRGYGELARQPLLLLLLAIVLAERDLPSEETSAGLYRILLDEFMRRELARPDQDVGHLSEVDRREAELWKLGLVAFGMVNRGQQHLHEQDLTADLRALPGPVTAPASRGRDVGRTLDPARRVVGRFFFMHTSEAEAGAGGRSYEFLHATFADYLIAHHAAALLRDAAAARKLRTSSQSWDDDLLFALLSHTVIVAFGSRAVDFFAELVGGDPEVAAVLEHLAVIAHDRWGKGRHADYDPSGNTAVQRIATYTANITSLRLAMATAPVSVDHLGPRDPDFWSWPALVRLWGAALQLSEWTALIGRLQQQSSSDLIAWGQVSGYFEDMEAELSFDAPRALRLAVGRSLTRHENDPSDLPGPAAAVRLAAALRTWSPTADTLALLDHAEELPPDLLRLAVTVAARHAADIEPSALRRLLELCEQATIGVPPESMAAILVRHPQLIGAVLTIIAQPMAMTMLGLLAQIDDEVTAGTQWRRLASDVADTPEAEAVRAMPPDLARRVIPELAASILSRTRPAIL
jgi:hypothetical protein